ncbi:MAG: hypothetical protein AAGG01_18440, partial [Planctomycetota bacterium]
MSSSDIQLDRAAMALARRAVESEPSERLGWLLRSGDSPDILERAIQLILAFDPDGQELGIELLPEVATPATPARVPDFIDRFEITGLLGAGSFSYVYRARDAARDQDVALKVLHAAD